MKRVLLLLLLVFVIGFGALILGRFLFGGDEDTLLCVNNKWIKHGNPNAPIPRSGCGDNENNWQIQTIDEIGISFKYPKDTTFRKEVASDSAGIHTVGLYIERKEPSYTFYGVYQPNRLASSKDIELSKKEMDPKTIKEVVIGGIKGIEGLILGPKTRYITIFLKNNRLFTISTFPPTSDNKTLTDQILATLTFK